MTVRDARRLVALVAAVTLAGGILTAVTGGSACSWLQVRDGARRQACVLLHAIEATEAAPVRITSTGRSVEGAPVSSYRDVDPRSGSFRSVNGLVVMLVLGSDSYTSITPDDATFGRLGSAAWVHRSEGSTFTQDSLNARINVDDDVVRELRAAHPHLRRQGITYVVTTRDETGHERTCAFAIEHGRLAMQVLGEAESTTQLTYSRYGEALELSAPDPSTVISGEEYDRIRERPAGEGG